MALVALADLGRCVNGFLQRPGGDLIMAVAAEIATVDPDKGVMVGAVGSVAIGAEAVGKRNVNNRVVYFGGLIDMTTETNLVYILHQQIFVGLSVG